MNNATILKHYTICALWSSVDDDGEPLDSAYSIDDISAQTIKQMQADIDAFIESNEELLMESGMSDEQIGHDFWLTRNGHGSGFWDRGLGSIGEALTKASKPFGSSDLYVGDDGLIY